MTRRVKEFKKNSLICADEFKPLTLTRRKRVPCMPGENTVDEPIDDPLLSSLT